MPDVRPKLKPVLIEGFMRINYPADGIGPGGRGLFSGPGSVELPGPSLSSGLRLSDGGRVGPGVGIAVGLGVGVTQINEPSCKLFAPLGAVYCRTSG